jgi:penicillin-binding protein 1C
MIERFKTPVLLLAIFSFLQATWKAACARVFQNLLLMNLLLTWRGSATFRKLTEKLPNDKRVALLLTLVAFMLAACDAQPTVSLRRDAQVAMALVQAEVNRRIEAYHARYQLAPRPDGDLRTVAETYMRRYQPGPEPRIFESSVLYDRKGRILTEIFDEGRRVWKPLSQVSPALVQAIIATEDATFYTNRGVDRRRAVAALVQNLANPDQLSGASTITMQLARNLFMPPAERFQPTLERKINEVLLAQELTELFTKDEILEMYLNLVYFGHRAYGPEAAARTYFGKSALALSMAEATLLAGLPQQPARLDPFLNFEAAKRRQRIVLDLMVRHGYLNAAAADRIFAEPITLAEDPDRRPTQAPHFVQYVRDSLARYPELGNPGRTGLHVYTTLDLDMHNLAQQIVSEQVRALRPRFNLTNAALVALKPGTAEILVMVGSADFNDARIGGQVNVVLRERQPGSAIKPVLYAAAFDANLISPATVLWDLSVTYPVVGARPYTPRNYDGRLRGPVTARMALAGSLNVPAVKLMEGVGLERFVEAANRMGVRSLSEDDIRRAGLAMTLGGSEVTLFDLAVSYHTIANHGLYVEPTAILRVTDARGRPIPLPPQERRQAISPAAAYLVTDILSDNDARTPIFGVNSPLRLSRPAAAKTGTTTSFRDNLTVGYTRYLVAGVWAGNNDGRPMRNATGVTGAAPIWKMFMEAVMADPVLLRTLDAPEDPAAWAFEQPDDVVRIAHPCPRELYCPPQGEIFTRKWIETHLLSGPYADAYQSGLFSRVRVDRSNGQSIQPGVCLQQRTAFDDPDAQVALMLPRGFGELAPQWRYVDASISTETLASLESDAIPDTPPALRPFLPTPGAQRPAVFDFPDRVLEEQRSALRWAQGRNTLLSLGTCAEAEGIVRALYGDTVRRIVISEPPRRLVAAVNGTLTVTETTILTDTLEATAVLTTTEATTETPTEIASQPEAPVAAFTAVGAGIYQLSSISTDNNCPGNYIMGRVLNRQGAPVGGVVVQMVDQWGNRATAVSKSGAVDAGQFDFPIYSGSRLELSFTVIGPDGAPASPTVTLRYPPESGDARCYHLVWRNAQG